MCAPDLLHHRRDVETFQKILGACSAGRILAGGLQQSAGFHSPAALPSPEEKNPPVATQLQFSLTVDAMMQPFEGDFYTSCLEAVL